MKDTNESSPAPAKRGSTGWRNHAFIQVMQHRNYRLYSIGDGVSLLGNWTQRVAIACGACNSTRAPTGPPLHLERRDLGRAG